MRKPLASRIIGLSALYCAVFFLLVIFQFSNKGNFSLNAGSMSVRGRYLPLPAAEFPAQEISQLYEENDDAAQADESIERPVAGGIKIFYQGIEFNLKEERGKGLSLTGDNGAIPVNPAAMLLKDNSVRFMFPGGTTVLFNSLETHRGAELQISAEFADNISEITIPITPRRSSIIRDNEQIGIGFGGDRFFFSTQGHELENGKVVLSKENSSIAYKERGKQKEFIPTDFIIEQAQNYETILRDWRQSSFTFWSQNAYALQYEDDITAYLAESVQRGFYTSAVNAVSANILNTPRQTYKSMTYVGGMSNVYPSFISAETEKINLITRLTQEKSLAVFKEEHILNYLFTRNNLLLANEVIDLIKNAEEQKISIDYCAGLLEAFYDLRQWQPFNYTEHLTEQIILAISENLHRAGEEDIVYVSSSDNNTEEYSLRLGKALVSWTQYSRNEEVELNVWADIGKSLVISALSGRNSGKFYNTLNLSEYSPKAIRLTETGHWGWTILPAIRTTATESNITFSFTFQIGMSHFVIIRGVRPFLRLQIYGVDWRQDTQPERYDSSGFFYNQQDQVLVMKVRHRSTTENVRLIYREAPRPAAPAPLPAPSSDAGE